MHLIVNPAAAGGRVGKHWRRIRERLRRVGLDLPFTLTKAPSHATELAQEVVARGDDLVVAAGGDGTICEVAEGLHRAGRGALGILPLGTGNDAARTLRLPLRLEDAARTLAEGVRRRVDLIRAGDRVALNAIGIGLLGDINVKAQRVKFVRGIAAYLATAAVSLFRYRGPEVEIEADGFTYRGSLLIMAVHSGPSTGGGFQLTPHAVPDDGTLDACVVENLPVPSRLQRLLAALRGPLGDQPGSHPFRFTQLELRTPVALPAHLDGNPWQVAPPGIRFQVLPAALEVVAPRG